MHASALKKENLKRWSAKKAKNDVLWQPWCTRLCLDQISHFAYREVDLKMTDKNLEVQLENLMGAGFVGAVANYVLEAVGEDLMYSNRQVSSTYLE